MKKIFTYIVCGIILTGSFSSCEEYLDQAPAAELQDKDIFGKYETFQGFEDQLFLYLFEPLQSRNGGGMWFSDETHSSGALTSTYNAISGDYWTLLEGPGGIAQFSLFVNSMQTGGGGSAGSGFWTSSWNGIRIANIALSQLPTLETAQTATQEQKDLLKGNALFFRGFNHLQLMQIWGGLPYIDTLLTADMNINFPRPTLRDGMRKAVTDLTTAARLLPNNWDESAEGAATPGKNEGRPTKGSAYGMAAKALLFMGSPLNNESTQYDEALCKESAQTGWQVIKLANAGYHRLMDVTEDKGDPGDIDYKRNFVGATLTAAPYTRENLLVKFEHPTYQASGNYPMGWGLAQNMFPRSSGGVSYSVAASQNIVDLFETVNGKLPEDDPAYDPDKPWANRDPRFYNVILTDGTPITVSYKVNCYAYDDTGKPGVDFGTGQTETGYFIKKWWIYGCTNASGGNRPNVTVQTPMLRLAEVYLNYAEALIAAGYAPSATPTFANGENGISALDAINRLHRRIYTKTGGPILPNVNMTLYGGPGKDGTVKGSFMEKIWNERAVELCFERSRWIDLRRWHVAHLDKYRNIFGMRFNKAHTKFEKVQLAKINFESRHYWMPIPRAQLGLYQEYQQNPGW
ncbi:MAG: RagB/SusD family nutrient uptake outer membrane protein [Prolixibacteraceae bacterium]|jgi:hypothetical protein|nr:RagB/SusD family nutrient uptake outer membrane protein [Prolixibacteraceae bacterium]